MRRGIFDKEVITSEITSTADGRKSGGQVIGINLGWDFIAEHECGIKGIKKAFGVPEKAMRRRVRKDFVGADVRTVSKTPRSLRFFENIDGYAYLIYTDATFLTNAQMIEHFIDSLKRGNDELETSWADYDNNGQFGIRIKNDALNIGTMVIGQLYEALKRRDAMIFLVGSDSPFARAGLVIAIRSRLPAEWLTKMKEVDEDHLNLTEAVEKVGIEAKLKAAKRGYYALWPAWASSIKSTKDGEIKTEHPVIFFLNPQEQRESNSGWYSVEQLLDWIDGKGPILKKSSVA